MENISDVLIIGSGPAGYTSGIYAARANHKPVLICGPQLGGQLTITSDIENFPGFPEKISGPELMEKMRLHSQNSGVELVNDIVTNVDFSQKVFSINCESGKSFQAKSVIIATGASAKWLNIPSETEYRGRGVSACATCDGFFFRKKKVAVIGGGNTAVEEALYLSGLAEHVYLVHRKSFLTAEKIQQDRLFSKENITVLWNHQTDEILGNGSKVTGIRLQNTETKEFLEVDLNGVFIAIGHKPNSEIFKGQLKINDYGYIETENWSTKTSVQGVFAAGDVRDFTYRQAITSAGQGCMAAIEADKYLAKLA